MKQALKTIWMSARPPFLLLTVSVILLGAALAAWEGVPFDWQRFVLVMIGGLAAHASVNLLNEYEDWRSGLDAMTERTPFSGGSGALQAHPEHAEYVMGAGYFLLGVVIAIGLYFIRELGWGLLPIGLLGIALIVFYTTRLTRMPWLCLIAPGLAFGPLMVVGTYYVLSGHYSERALVVSLIPFFLVNNLLLLNQIPDIDADRRAGRITFPMKMGLPLTLQVFDLFLLSAYGLLVMLVALQWLPPLALLGLITLIFAMPMLLNLRRFRAGNHERLLPALGMNVVINLLTPALIAATLWWQGT